MQPVGNHQLTSNLGVSILTNQIYFLFFLCAQLIIPVWGVSTSEKKSGKQRGCFVYEYKNRAMKTC
jgi:hypothetical protein